MQRLNAGPGALRAQRNKQYHSAPQQPSERNRRYNDGAGAGHGFVPSMLRSRPADVRRRMADARLLEQEQCDEWFATRETHHVGGPDVLSPDMEEVLRWVR